MKYWKVGKNSNGYGEECLLLKGGDGKLLSITHNEDGTIMFMEECDGHFSENYKKEEALELLEELINYIKYRK